MRRARAIADQCSFRKWLFEFVIVQLDCAWILCQRLRLTPANPILMLARHIDLIILQQRKPALTAPSNPRPEPDPLPTPRPRRAHFVRRLNEHESIVVTQAKAHSFDDFYHRALTASWPRLGIWSSALYLVINALFALLYLLQPNAITGARAGSFADAFFFSVQTMGTIGYGVLSPATVYANVLVTCESILGMVFVAVTTGLVFARISIPRSKIRFGQYAVIGPFQGVPTLHFRIANERRNKILQAEVTVTLLRYETTAEGTVMRRFYDLELVRSRSPVFELTFSLMHAITASSPLALATAQSLEAEQAELVITVAGLDETMGQTIHARYSYQWDEVLWNHRFVDIFVRAGQAATVLDMDRFDDVQHIG